MLELWWLIRNLDFNGNPMDWTRQMVPSMRIYLAKEGSRIRLWNHTSISKFVSPEIRNPSLSETARIVQNLIENKIARNLSLREVMTCIQRFSYRLHINGESEVAPNNTISCGVCFVNKIDTLILICGHAYCGSCVKRTPLCAFCRGPVKYTHPIFLPFYVPK